MTTTRPASDAAGPAAISRRMIGFVSHLRGNDFHVGPAETRLALDLLRRVGPADLGSARDGLRTLLAGRKEEWDRFDDLFEAYWFARGRVRTMAARDAREWSAGSSQPTIWSDHLADHDVRRSAPSGPAGPADEDGPDGAEGPGRLAASTRPALHRTDLRHITDPDEMAEAERIAFRIARAMRHRLSRRYRAGNRGARIDLRRTIRANIPSGGDPIRLVFKRRPDRPVRIVVLLDVSGSMEPYSRFLLQFVKGLVCTWIEADAYLFHTKLVRVTDAVREKDSVKAMTRLALLADGFGGGTRLGECLGLFNDRYAKTAINARTVFLVLSDGYDTGSEDRLAHELQRLKRRARRLVWLNPLLGWRSYEPVNRAMTAALPFIDHFATAHTLDALAEIERELERL